MSRDDLILLGLSSAGSAAIGYFLWRWDVIRPTSFPPRKQRDVAGVPTVVWMLCAMVIYLGLAEGAFIAGHIPASVLGEPTSLRHTALFQLAAYAIAIAVATVVVFLLRARVSDKSGLNWRWPDAGRGVVAMVLLAPVCVLVSLLTQKLAGLITGQSPDNLDHETLRQIVDNRHSAWAWIIAATAVIGAPIVEEILYRVMLQSCFLRVLDRAWPAIIGTSAIFAAMHFVGGGPVSWRALPTLFTLSVGIGIAFERTRGLATPITMHVLFNAANIALAILQR